MASAERARSSSTIASAPAARPACGRSRPATPIDLAALVHPAKRVVRARYEFEDGAKPALWDAVATFVKKARLAGSSFAPAWVA